MRMPVRTAGLLLTALAWAAPLHAQSASEIVQRMLDQYAERTAGIENYTVVQDAMGMETRVYFEKVEVEGRPVFQLRQTQAGEVSMSPPNQNVDEIYMLGAELARIATYEGVCRFDGKTFTPLPIPASTREDSVFGPTSPTGQFFGIPI